ncbi:hypothetical protein BN1013_02426 [Candidatus Rubidus massiliensis]|nr:hypothetical protein BN1013_02426 [Candidatus Rubidus massiliensis]
MKKFYLTISMILCIFSCYAQITQVNNMKEVFEYFTEADSKTLAIFDVDMVLVQPSDPAFQMANMKRFGAISKRIMKEVPTEKQMMFLSLMTTSSDPVLIDNSTPQFLKQIIQKGIPVMALTANLTGSFGTIRNMEQWRVNSLRCLGIDFSESASYQAPLIFDNLASYRGYYSNYLNGILFVNGTVVSKGDAFLAFIEKTKLSPERIIFIDDREDNLKSLEAAIQKLDKPVEYHGLHYIGAQKYPSQMISEEEFEARWQKLALEAKELN